MNRGLVPQPSNKIFSDSTYNTIFPATTTRRAPTTHSATRIHIIIVKTRTANKQEILSYHPINPRDGDDEAFSYTQPIDRERPRGLRRRGNSPTVRAIGSYSIFFKTYSKNSNNIEIIEHDELLFVYYFLLARYRYSPLRYLVRLLVSSELLILVVSLFTLRARFSLASSSKG